MEIATHPKPTHRWATKVAAAVATALAVFAATIVEASDVAVTSVVDVTAPTGSVTLAPGNSGNITINMTVTGSQAGTATFEVYRNWQLSGGVFTGSNPEEFTVPTRAGGDPATTFSATGTVTVGAGQSAGLFTLTVGAFDITNSNATGAKLAVGSSATYLVTVPASVAPTVSSAVSPTLANGLNGWYTSGPIGIDWTVTGTPAPATTGCADVSISADQAKTDYTCTATNAAGNDTETVEDIGLDSTPPTLTWVGGPADGGSYYDFEVPGAATCTAADVLSGPNGCAVTGYSSAAGEHTLTATAHDLAGNQTIDTRSYTVLASVAPTVSSVVSPAPPNGSNGWYRTGPIGIDWTVTGTPLPTKTGCDDVSVAADQAMTDYTCTATNGAGSDSETVEDIGLDSTPPTLTWVGGPADGGSYYDFEVPSAATCNAADVLSGQNGCDVTGYSTAVGQHTLTATAHDVAGNTTVETRTYTVLQSVPADVDVAVVPSTPNGLNGWYKTGPVDIDWTVTGAPAPTASVDCADRSITVDQAKTDYTCEATNPVGSDSVTVTVGLDSTAPTLTWVGGPADGGSYYDFEVPAAATCTAVDGLSGPNGCDVTGYSAAVGQHTLTATAHDKAGNETVETRTYTVLQSIPADVAVAVDPATPNGSDGWYNTGPVKIDWTVTGAPAPNATGCDDVIVSADQAKTDYTCEATNPVGSDSVTITIGLDSTAPTLTWDSGPADGASYYDFEVPGAATCTAVDGLSGPNGCGVTGYSAAVGEHTLTATAHDEAGNEKVETRTYTVLQSVPADVAVAVTPSTPNGSNGWYKTGPISIDWTITGAPAPTTSPDCTDRTVTEDQAKTSYTCEATNPVGTDSVTVTVGLDSTAPTVTWNGGPANGASYPFGSVPGTPTCTAGDTRSGPDGCTVTGHATAVGEHTMTATAHDQAGNETIEVRTYKVTWTLHGFYQPVDMGANVWNTVKGGSTVPLKFEVFEGSTELTATAVVESFVATPVACPNGTFIADAIEFTTTGQTALRYDSTAGQFVQNWQTPKKPGACYRVTMTTDDDSSLSANFQLK